MGKTGFAGIIGHKAVCQALESARAHGRLAHAYLFSGPPGVGKTTVAEALLKELGLDPHTSPDVLMVTRLTDEKTGKRKKEISVEQIREAVERLSMTSITGGRKAVVIEEADRLSAGAFNSLLKTLEEPRGDALLLLCTETPESVPATILSRCQLLRLHPVSRTELTDALRKRGLSGKDAEELARLSAGRPGAALRLIQDAQARAEIDTATASLASLKEEGITGRLRLVAELLPKDESDKPATLGKLLDVWESLLRDDLLKAILEGRGDPVSTVKALRTLHESRAALRHNGNPQLVLEHAVLAFPTTYNLSGEAGPGSAGQLTP